MRISPRLRYAAQDLTFVARRAAKRAGAVLTPLRITVAVAAVAVVALIVSQFMDYRGVAVGGADYALYPGIENVAPAPEVEVETAGSAHAYLLLPLAAAALFALALVLAGRRRLGWVVAWLGLIAAAVVLVIDLPAALDEGDALQAYAGAEASLKDGFWLELVAAGVLAATGVLAVLHGRAEGGGRG